jgi:hypothetical protein
MAREGSQLQVRNSVDETQQSSATCRRRNAAVKMLQIKTKFKYTFCDSYLSHRNTRQAENEQTKTSDDTKTQRHHPPSQQEVSFFHCLFRFLSPSLFAPPFLECVSIRLWSFESSFLFGNVTKAMEKGKRNKKVIWKRQKSDLHRHLANPSGRFPTF